MRIIRISQCYFCPYFVAGNSTALDDIGFCQKKVRSLSRTMMHVKENIYTQTIPEWCPLERDEKEHR